jgi:phosphatidylglycerophosphatase A
VASGTVGSGVALVLLWLIPFTTMGLVWATLVVTLLGIWSGGRVERVLGQKDPGIIVIDEVAGMALSVLFVPRTIPVLLVAFFLFRLFDVWKPFPAHESQALTGGLGVMVDDLIAGVYALVLVMGARALFGVPA